MEHLHGYDNERLMCLRWFQGRVLCVQHDRRLPSSSDSAALEASEVPLRQRADGHAHLVRRSDDRRMACVRYPDRLRWHTNKIPTPICEKFSENALYTQKVPTCGKYTIAIHVKQNCLTMYYIIVIGIVWICNNHVAQIQFVCSATPYNIFTCCINAYTCITYSINIT